MAKIGLAYLAWAKIAAETDTALPTYETGMTLGKAVKADLTVTNAEGQLYADNTLSEDVSEFSSGSIAIETDHMPLTKQATVFGTTLVNDELGNGPDDTPPFAGAGYYQVLVVGGERIFRAFYYPKVKAKMGDETAGTKTNSITLGTAPMALTVFVPSYGKWRYVKDFTTESGAKAYIQTKLNVAAWYQVNVQANGATTGEGVSPVGTTMVATGDTASITITGTPTAVYDNGTDVLASVVGGKYDVSVTADHNISVIF